MGWGSSWSNPFKEVTKGINKGLEKGTDLLKGGDDLHNVGSLLTNPLNAAGDAMKGVADATVAPTLGYGASLLTKGFDVGDDFFGGIFGLTKKYGDKTAQLGKEAISGKGGYGDDAGEDEEEEQRTTGGVFSDAKATGLTGIRTAKRGTLAHRSKGTASKVTG